MADEKRARGDEKDAADLLASEKASKKHGDKNEWIRDQVGEDHNLSGSSTYRTLPDQPDPETDEKGSKDAKDRQSNR